MAKRKNSRGLAQVAVGYVRRSTDKQEQSLEDQKKALLTYASEHGLSLQQFYEDDAISGTSVLHRHGFQKLIEDAQSRCCTFGTIVVYDLKRFGRVDNDEAGYYRHILRSHGVEIRYASENFTGDTTDDLLRPVKQWQARQESKDLSKVTIRGLLSKAHTGHWVGGVPPYGYDLRYESADGEFILTSRFMPDGSKQILNEEGKLMRTLKRGESLTVSKRDYARLILSDPQRVKRVRMIFSWYVDLSKGFKAIAHTLNQRGYPAPRNSDWSHIYKGKWTNTTIRAIIVNPHYVGDMVWNRRTDGRFHRIEAGRAVDRDGIYGARLVPNAKADWITVQNSHDPIISRRVFEQAEQKRLKRTEPSGNPNHGKTWHGKRSQFILSGMMTCVLCGSRYQGVTRTNGKTPRKHRYYGCGGYITKGKTICSHLHGIEQKSLEKTVIDTVLGYYRQYQGQAGRKRLAALIKDQVGCETQDMVSAQQRAQNEHQQITQSINNLLDNITAENREIVNKRLNELKTQLREIEARLAELDQLILSQAQIKGLQSEAAEFLGQLEWILTEGEPYEKLMALRQCIKQIKVDKPKDLFEMEILMVPVAGLEPTILLYRSVAV